MLGNALLSSIEYRGTDASGFAWANEDGTRGYYKEPVRGSHLSLKSLPKNASAVILHTRLGTHGPKEVNANNHPVQSPEGEINLVHNGVIWNHDDIRHQYGFNTLPEVDSSVIPALIEKHGVEAVENLAGDAAIAWLDGQTSNTLHVAKVHGNPIAYATLLDGSFVFASTQELLAAALLKADLKWVGYYPDPFAMFEERDYIQVLDGVITQYHQLPESQGWGYYHGGSRSAWKNTTSGGHSKRTTGGIGSEWNVYGMDKDDTEAYANWWNERGTWDDGDESPSQSEGQTPLSWEEDMNIRNIGQKAIEARNPDAGPARADQFYVIDHDGDYTGFKSLDTLTNALLWYAGLTTPGGQDIPGTDGDTDRELRWVRFFQDVGEVREDAELLSWVDSPELTFHHEHEIMSGDLSYIRNGGDLLAKVLGI